MEALVCAIVCHKCRPPEIKKKAGDTASLYSHSSSALKQAFSTALITLVLSDAPRTVRTFDGFSVSTSQLSSPSASFKKGVAFATQPEHFMVVLNLIVSIVFILLEVQLVTRYPAFSIACTIAPFVTPSGSSIPGWSAQRISIPPLAFTAFVTVIWQ